MSRTAAAAEIERDRRTYTRAKGSSFVQGVFYPEHARDFHTQVQMSMRDALDRLEGVTDPRELRSRLAQSHELGDSLQAKANFLSMYPGEVETWNQFMDAAEAHNDLERMGPGYAPDPRRGVNVAPEQGLAPLRAVE